MKNAIKLRITRCMESTMMMKIGIIGLGMLGNAVALHLTRFRF